MMKYYLIVILIGISMLQGCRNSEQNVIRASVEEKLEKYPASTLRDLYKSYFQDYYGPGHLISDTGRAIGYLEYELGLNDYKDTVLLDPTGYEGNFYRVNLMLVKEETIPKEEFTRYFLESVSAVDPMPVDAWSQKWQVILAEITEVAPGLPGFDEDRAYLDSLIDAGKYVVHHSEQFMENYHPHYRIIHREIFEDHLRRFMKD